MELGIIGDEDFVLGFKLVGIRKTFIPTMAEPLEHKINEAMADEDIGILVMEDKDFRKLDHFRQMF